MSASEVTAPAVTEPTVSPAAAATESTPAVETTTLTQDDQPSPTPAVPADQTTTEGEVAQPAAADSSQSDEFHTSELKPAEKKDRKQGRKPFVELFNKILKPHPKDTALPENKAQVDAPVAVEEAVPEAIVALAEAPVAEPEVSADEPTVLATIEDAVTVDAPAEAALANDATKETSTPRKERGNIFEKFTAFVLKPKSPKCKKSETPKQDGEEVQPDAPAVEATAEAQTAENAAPSSPEVIAPQIIDTTETPAAQTSAINTDTPEETMVEKKEKTPKDLAKLARRFSGRLFGVDKKKENSKKPEPTQEEAEAAAQTNPCAEVATAPDAAPPIAAEPTPEATQSTADPVPVIAAAA